MMAALNKDTVGYRFNANQLNRSLENMMDEKTAYSGLSMNETSMGMSEQEDYKVEVDNVEMNWK